MVRRIICYNYRHSNFGKIKSDVIEFGTITVVAINSFLVVVEVFFVKRNAFIAALFAINFFLVNGNHGIIVCVGSDNKITRCGIVVDRQAHCAVTGNL